MESLGFGNSKEKRGKGIKVFVKASDGSQLEIGDLSPRSTVEELKGKIESKTGVRTTEHDLFQSGRMLSHESTLQLEGIEPGSSIDLVLRLREMN